MIFNSYVFLLAFLPFALLGFHVLRRWDQEKSLVWFLSLASLLFYGAWNPAYLSLLLASILVNYSLGRIVMGAAAPLRFVFLTTGVCLNLGLLGYYKYANFFLGTLNDVSGAGFSALEIILPLAISFFTFQQVAYLVDCYRGLCGERSFGRYLLFVSFFPQLIAGPIVHHKEMMPQFNLKSINDKLETKIAHGIVFLVLGLAKKVLLADSLAPYAISVFDGDQVPGGAEAWLGTVAYSLQLYFDFSGYTDMAIGIALLFGIRLPDNFDSPYKAVSIIDFWRRWHMTLSRFLRDYLYIPLGGNRKGVARRYANLAATMLLGGLWHGAAWTFVLWGAMHGLLLVINHAWHHVQRSYGLLWLSDRWVYRIACRALTLLAVMNCWVIFRAESLDRAAAIYRAMYLPSGWGELFSSSAQSPQQSFYQLLLVATAIALLSPNIKQMLVNADGRPPWLSRAMASNPFSRVFAVALACMAVFIVTRLNSFSEFLYFQF